ncbi:MAG: glycosyltransferase family 39 protein [Flavobacteriales bacterium]|nr:glycosyltransferase family 39 protein [Flavobacteriales bacterium]MBK6893914.1 glycosyltransferase family 39 protein [Flavobacteriales bacterium]MBK7247859.1 glycosyltransferase family 39 protein [Flavobacteriales bacterium]MBK9060302.1 glycosyltransferase family 39 protein [Flavobacteriales bacterium]MBK9598923.1 glycosyltransferase family 39 protein [Flavobacteriales bacterium]
MENMRMKDFVAGMKQRPLFWLTLIALLPRVVAAIFSGGYFAQDDHFLVIEAAQSWVDGFDYNNWLPWNQGADPVPSGHMMLYPGFHFLLFKLCGWLGLTDPSWKMVLVRLLHALWSLITVRAGYRIALRLSTPEVAWRCGLFLALFFFMPFLSVRNLVEMVSIPPLMLCAWWLIRTVARPTWKDALVAGMFAGLAIDLRFQSAFFGCGAGLALLLLRDVRGAVLFGVGMLIPVVLVQAGIDMFIWGRPFAEMTEYVRYNLANSTTYFDQPWYNYLLVLAGIFIPPFSLAVLFGFFKRPKPLLIWLPVFSFLFFHSLFPNKQERFILTIVPMVLVLGYTVWETFREKSSWWQRHRGLWRGVLAWTWALNIVLLVPLCFSYSKRERVEAMLMLRDRPVHGVIIEDTAEQDPPMLPLFYLGQWHVTQKVLTDPDADVKAIAAQLGAGTDMVLFIGKEQLGSRVKHVEDALGPMRLIGRAEPGLLDRVMHWLNPVNRNVVITIYAFGTPTGD